MPDWINNPHADYVLAAYGVAAAALLWLGAASFLAARQVRAQWQKRQTKN